MFDTIMSLLIPIVFVIIAVGNILARARKAQSGDEGGEESEQALYQATPDEIRRFLQTISGAPPAPPAPPRPSAPLGMPQGTVTPTRRRSAGIAPPPPVWPPAKPVRPPMIDEPETTRRLVPDDERLVPTVEGHVKSRRLAPDQKSLDTSVESHLKERRLDESQHTFEPGIDEHLKAGRLEDKPIAAQRRTGGGGTGSLGARQTQQTTLKGIVLPALGRAGLKQAIVLSEILAPPVCMRSPGTGPGTGG